jgi:amidohydrolase
VTQHLETITADIVTEAVSWRHHLHQHPELAFNEHQTSEFITAQLIRFGLVVSRGLAGTGVVGTLSRGTSRRAIGIRADMDALPILEQNSTAHVSCKPGVMHACGHDGHVAIALAAAQICSKLPDLDGTVHFIFQPAEENQGGGRRMVEEGLFRQFPCDRVYALHNWPSLPLGKCVARDGAMMAAMGVFEVEISGRGCHGAMPHEGTDAILAASHLVCALQSIVSRNVDPLSGSVVSVTQFNGGDTWNVIPQACVIRGSTRWFDERVGEILERRINELSHSVATGFGCKAQIRYERRFPATINNPEAASIVRTIAGTAPANLTVVDAGPSMGSEDFAYMLQAVPGCYLWLGTAKSESGPGLHSPHFDFNDDALPLGVGLWVSVVRESLRVA